ncbi:MAG: cyclic nucleotide-binding domain-containing protein [Bdellovibrionota bacterium]
MVLKERLKTMKLFQGFSDEDIGRVAEYMVEKFFPGGAVIIRDQVIGEGLYFVYSGKVDILKGGIGKEELVIAHLGPGQHVGEMGLIDNKPTTAKVLANGPSVLYFLDRIKYRALVDNHPTIAVKFLEHFCRTFCERLRSTNELLVKEKQMSTGLAARLEVHQH